MYEESLIYKVTWCYYAANMTQQEIADHLNISRMRVVKLLNQAKSEGIIKFKIDPEAKMLIDYEQALISKFNISDAFVIPSTPTELNENLAMGAAQYIEDKIESDALINIGYGDTVSRTINHLIYSIDKPISLVTLTGGVSYYTSAIVSGAKKMSANNITPTIHIIPAPLLASSEEIAHLFLEEKSIKHILDMTKLSKMSIVGIGSVSDNATIFKYGIADKDDLTLLKMQGAVGDILSHFFDQNGQPIESELQKKLIGTSLDALKSSHKTIAVAGGSDKVQAIHAALIGGYVDVLVTDQETTKALLDYPSK